MVIGGHVDFGAGKILLGPIEVGDHAEIGANAVVAKNVPSYSIAAGILTRVRSINNTALPTTE